MEVSVEYSERTLLCKLIISDLDVFERLREHFSIPNEGKKFIKGPQKRFIPDRIYFLTPTGSCLFGMAPDMLAWIQKNVHDRTVKYKFSDDFKKRVKSQMKGYTSAEAEKAHKNDPFGNAEFKEIEGLEDRAKELDKKEVASKTNGLTSKHLDKNDVSNLRHRVYEDKFTRIRFKNTSFVTENHMISRIPDEYKINGKKFIMEDKNSNEYLVEWYNDEPKVLNTSKVNEQQARIKELFGYKRGNSNTTCHSRLDENARIDDMLGKVRKLMK